MNKEAKRQLETLAYGIAEIVPKAEFATMLEESVEKNKPLVVKCGIDPTASDIHIGHTIPFRKMRQFQDLGHKGVVIIGDYTAAIGDPTGKDQSRPPLSTEEIEKNAATYMDQLYSVLDKDKTEVRRQSEWFASIELHQLIRWAGATTVAKLLSHETFASRLENEQPLSLHELLYPVLQGIDSVEIGADVELGGSDQRFNVLMGRDYQRLKGMRPQVAMLLPLITGTCGQQKMSKSLSNAISILDEPFEKFGKVMSIPDNLMEEYYRYLGMVGAEEVESTLKALKSESLHPNIAKKKLARVIVAAFHGDKIASEMQTKFEEVFKKKQIPDEVPEFKYTRGASLADTLVTAKVLSSKKEVSRMSDQGAIRLFENGKEIKKLEDPGIKLDETFAGKVVKIGKRKFLKMA